MKCPNDSHGLQVLFQLAGGPAVFRMSGDRRTKEARIYLLFSLIAHFPLVVFRVESSGRGKPSLR